MATSPNPLIIRPRRSMAVFAVLAIIMVVLSYVVLLAMAAGCLFIPYWAFTSEVANIQILALSLFAVAVAGALLWSLVPKRDKFEPPGPLLNREEQPRLFAELDRIAASLNEPLPREVYLIGDMNAWVADRGGIMGFGSRRIMGLGLPLLSLLSVSEFRAVLAHEFAHFYGGDTRLGPWVYKTRTAIIRVFENVGSLRALARINILAALYIFVTTILKWYFILFMRITNLVSRRQEFRADELACIVAGPQPLIDGLRTINGAGPAWPTYWQTEVAPLLDDGALPRIGDGFAHFVSVPEISVQITAILNHQLANDKGKPYDTHPPLRERIAAANKLPASAELLESQPARTLVEDTETLERTFVKTMFPRVAADSLKPVPWDRMVTDVTVPAWRKTLHQYGGQLQGLTLETLPDAMPRLEKIGSELADPKGMLLSREQRQQRALGIVGMGVGLALVDHGWELHSQPGVLYLQNGTEQLNPFRVTGELAAGKLKREEWVSRCRAQGISEYAIGVSAEK